MLHYIYNTRKISEYELENYELKKYTFTVAQFLKTKHFEVKTVKKTFQSFLAMRCMYRREFEVCPAKPY